MGYSSSSLPKDAFGEFADKVIQCWSSSQNDTPDSEEDSEEDESEVELKIFD
jgi:hypothetical protein